MNYRPLSFDDLLRCRSIREFAPRLALARDQLIKERREARERRMWLRDRKLDAERLVSHRELELIRANSRGKRSAIWRRHRLLDEAIRELATYCRLVAEAERPERERLAA